MCPPRPAPPSAAFERRVVGVQDKPHGVLPVERDASRRLRAQRRRSIWACVMRASARVMSSPPIEYARRVTRARVTRVGDSTRRSPRARARDARGFRPSETTSVLPRLLLVPSSTRASVRPSQRPRMGAITNVGLPGAVAVGTGRRRCRQPPRTRLCRTGVRRALGEGAEALHLHAVQRDVRVRRARPGAAGGHLQRRDARAVGVRAARGGGDVRENLPPQVGNLGGQADPRGAYAS